jgi:aerobic carbon-monoxide dehydrogenase small subunit
MQGVTLQMHVNGEPRSLTVEPLATLATVLRDGLGLTGTHLGCEEGVCGSCTVLVDGRSVRACLTLAAQMQGASIIKVEGFAAVPRLAAVQSAFVEHFAAQCGFCTSGMMAVVSEYLSDRTVDDPAAEKNIRERLNAVICRCTGYQSIVNAVRALVQRPQAADDETRRE